MNFVLFFFSVDIADNRDFKCHFLISAKILFVGAGFTIEGKLHGKREGATRMSSQSCPAPRLYQFAGTAGNLHRNCGFQVPPAGHPVQWVDSRGHSSAAVCLPSADPRCTATKQGATLSWQCHLCSGSGR